MRLVHVRRARIRGAFRPTTLYLSRRTARFFCRFSHGWLAPSTLCQSHFLPESTPCCPIPPRAQPIYIPRPCRDCCPRGCRIGIVHAIGRARNDSLGVVSYVRALAELPTECRPRQTAC